MAKVAIQIAISLSDIGVTPTSPNKIDIIEFLKKLYRKQESNLHGIFQNKKCTFQIPTKWPRLN